MKYLRTTIIGLVALVVWLAGCTQSPEVGGASSGESLQTKIEQGLSGLKEIAPGVRASATSEGLSLVMFPPRFTQKSVEALESLVQALGEKGIRDVAGEDLTQWREAGLRVAALPRETSEDLRRLLDEALRAYADIQSLDRAGTILEPQGSDYNHGWNCTAAASAWPTTLQPGAKAEAWVSCSSYRSDTEARAKARAGNNRDSDYDSGRYGSSAFAVAYVGNSYNYCTSSAEGYGYYWVSDWVRITDALAYTSNYSCQ